MQAQESQITKISAPELKDAIRCCFDAKRPVFVWGNPGIGKSQIFGQISQEDERPLLDIRASQWDAVDTRGVPYVEEKRGCARTTRWAVPGIFPKDGNYLIALDELNTSAQAVQAALYQLVLDRRLGDYVLPEGADIVAAGNLDTDRAVTTRMSTALADRFVHFQLIVDQKAWIDWATHSDIAVEVIAYLTWRPENLHQFDPKSASKAQATPRGWEYVSDLVRTARKRSVSDAVMAALFTGKLGEAVGTEFHAFLGIMQKLKHWTEILIDPKGAPLYDEPSTNYALCSLIAQNASEDNFDNIVTYLDRLAQSPTGGPEYMLMCIKAITRSNPELQQTASYVRWASANSHWLV